MRYTKKEVFSIPNILGYFRILLIPLFTYLYLTAQSREYGYLIAAAVAAASGITDMLDGMIARKFGMITELGKILDPIADKLTQGALIMCLLVRYPAMWILVAIFAVKETAMCVAGIFSVFKNRKRLAGAMWFGKASTVVQFFAMTALFAFPNMESFIVNLFILVCALFMLLAFVMYMREYKNMNKKTAVH